MVSTRVACDSKSDTLSSKGRCPDLENVYRRVYIAVVMDFTSMATPIANRQVYEQVFLSTTMTDGCCGLPTSDGFNALATFLCLPSHLEHEVTEGEIGDLASPKAFHAVKVQVLKEREVKLADDFQSKFPMVILALTGNFAMRSGMMFTRTFAIVATAHLSRQLTIGTLYRFGRLFIELRRLVFRGIRTDEKVLDTEVKPCSITRLGFGGQSFVICCDGDVPITECVTFDRDTFDISLVFHENTKNDTSVQRGGFSQPAHGVYGVVFRIPVLS